MDDNTALVLVAAVNVVGIFITAYFGYLAAKRAKDAVKQIDTSIAVSQNNATKLYEIEHGMNGMKDELVKQTAIAAKAEGKEEGRTEAEIKADALAEVVAAAVKDAKKEN